MNLVRAEYQVENNKPILYLFQREKDRRILTKVDNFVPYFYVPETEKNNLKGIRMDPNIYHSLYGEPVRKVYVSLPSDVPELREKFTHTFEADILYPIRWTIDKVDNLEPCSIKPLFLDIETDNSGKVPNVDIAEEPVICITCYCNDIYTTFVFRHDLSPGISHREFEGQLNEVRHFKNEEDLLRELLKYTREEDPDVIVGWNSNRFDLPYLINRMKRLNVDYNQLSPMNSVYLREQYEIAKGQGVVIKGIAVMDLYDIYRRMAVQHGQEESYKLDFIGKKVVGIGKTEPQANIKWLWNYDLERLTRYNCTDCMITVKIDEKMGLLDFLEELRRLCYCNLEDCLTASRMTDSYILRRFHNKIIFPTKVRQEKYEYEGGYVGSWAEGIYENVITFDVTSMYPSIISAYNISTETVYKPRKNELDIEIDGIYVRREMGIIPEVVNSLFEKRIKYKNLMKKEIVGSDNWKRYSDRQLSIKILMNSIYGQFAFQNSRIHNQLAAELITKLGRKLILQGKEIIEILGYKVLYIDTDSIFWELGKSEIDLDEINKVLEILNSAYNDLIYEFCKGTISHIVEMELKAIHRKIFFGKAKKRYASHCVWDSGQKTDTLEIAGMEVRRSDSSQFSGELQKKVFSMLLREDKTKDEILRYIGEQIDRIRKGNYKFTEIGIPKGISKELSQYGNTVTSDESEKVKTKAGIPANIRGAIFTTKVLGHNISNKPKLIYVSKLPENLIKTYQTEKPVDVICFDEDSQIPPGTVVNIEKMLMKIARNKLEPVFEALGWRMSELSPFWRGKAPKEGMQESLFDLTNYAKIMKK